MKSQEIKKIRKHEKTRITVQILLVGIAFIFSTMIMSNAYSQTEQDKQNFVNETKKFEDLLDKDMDVGSFCLALFMGFGTSSNPTGDPLVENLCTSRLHDLDQNFGESMMNKFAGLVNVIGGGNNMREVIQTCEYLFSINDFKHLQGCTNFLKYGSQILESEYNQYYLPAKKILQDNPEYKQKLKDWDKIMTLQPNSLLID